jgi:V8-like Glu-specific endopeptidase
MAGVLNRKTAPGELNGAFLSNYDGARAGPSSRMVHAFRAPTTPAAGDRNNSGVLLHSAATSEEYGKARIRYELIVDQSNLLPFDFFRTGDRLGRAVVKIQRGDGASGTGFLVAPDVLLTNHHVLPDPSVAAESRAVANYERTPSPDPAGASAIVTLEPESLLVTSAELDFTCCGVRGVDYLGVVPLNRDSLSIDGREYVNIIQHPRGRPKEVAVQDNRVVKADNMVVHYSCDTEPGSSGSPVFNNQWRLVALHHASVPADDGAGPLGGPPRYLNEGIRLSAIAVWLESPRAAEIYRPEQLARLRSIFHGVDPQIGYFGTLGRAGAGNSAAEMVVESYHGRDDDLDLAFWNLRALRPRFRERLHEIGRVAAEMRVDLWCFAHADAEQAVLLRDYLKEQFALDYRVVVADPSPSLPLTILHRVGDGIQVERLADVAAPGSSIARPCLRVEAANRRGARSSFTIIPVAAGGWPRGERPNGAFPLPEVPGLPAGASDCVILGDGLTAEAVIAAARADDSLHYAAGDDGAILWRRGNASPVRHAYVSTNLGDFRRPEACFSVAHDRQWPSGLRSMRRGRPIVMRLPLNTGSMPKITDAGSRIPVPLDAALERLLRDMITPIVAKILAEGKH